MNASIISKLNNIIPEDLVDLQYKAYEAYKLTDYEKALDYYTQIYSISQSKSDLETSAEALLNKSIMNFYLGKPPKAFHYITESYELCNFLFDKNKNKLSFQRIYLRVLTNFTMINISLNLCDNALANIDTLVEQLDLLGQNVLKNEFLEIIIKNYFCVNPFEVNQINSTSGYNLLLKKTEENMNFGSDVFILIKTVNLIFFGFLNYLRHKNVDYFNKCLQEAISSLNTINENSIIGLPLINLSLVKILKEDTKNSKKIFKNFISILKDKEIELAESDEEEDTNKSEIQDNTEIDKYYSKIINEQYRKYETSKIIYDNLEKIYNRLNGGNENNNIFDKSEEKNKDLIVYKIILKKLKFKLENENKELIEILEKNNIPKEFIKDSNLKFHKDDKIRQQFERNQNKINRIDLGFKLLENFNFTNLLNLKDPSFKEIKQYYLDMLNRMLDFYETQRLRKYFKLFLKRTLIYDNIKDYRDYLKRNILVPQQKKYFIRGLDNFINFGYNITKFNFNMSGKKEKFMKFEMKEKEGLILFSLDKKFQKINKSITIDSISRVVYGVHTNNLKYKYSTFKRETYKKPWLFISFILKSSQKKSYKSIDLFYFNDEDLKETIFSLNMIKELYALDDLQIISNGNFLISKLKYKLIRSIQNNCKEEHPWIVQNVWSFSKILLFSIKKKLKIVEES
jgi:hypothetical protein